MKESFYILLGETPLLLGVGEFKKDKIISYTGRYNTSIEANIYTGKSTIRLSDDNNKEYFDIQSKFEIERLKRDFIKIYDKKINYLITNCPILHHLIGIDIPLYLKLSTSKYIKIKIYNWWFNSSFKKKIIEIIFGAILIAIFTYFTNEILDFIFDKDGKN